MKGKRRKILTLLQPSFLSKMGMLRRGGLSYLSSLSENLKAFQHCLFCLSSVHNREIQEVSGERVKFKNGRQNMQQKFF